MVHTPTTAPIQLGAFELTEPIGKGGMGVVWAGRHVASQTPVAVKVLASERARDADAWEAFHREVAAVAALDHPGIVPILDYGRIPESTAAMTDGAMATDAPFLVMELATGTLDARCGAMEWPELHDVLLRLLDALGHVHARGLVHLDLKPSNVLVVRGELRIADFGIAIPLDADAVTTLAGTPRYMAPEQMRGSTSQIGPWTDLFALGAVGWALACGRAPTRFGGGTTLNPAHGVPAGFEAWLARLMMQDPLRRYAMAADAAAGLVQLGSVVADPMSTPNAVHDDSVAAERTIGAADTHGTKAGSWWIEVATAPEIVPAERTRPDVPVDWRPTAVAAREPPMRAGLGLYGLRALPFAGRDEERDRAWAALRTVCASGSAQVLVIHGAPGTGKSRLARWLCERASEAGVATSMRAIHGRPPGPRDGLAPMVERRLLAQGLSRLGVAGQVRWLLGAEDAFQVGRITELVRPLAPGEKPGPVPRAELTKVGHRIAVVEEVIACLARERPVICCLDDVQWGADAVALARSLRGAAIPVLVVATVRSQGIAAGSVEAERVSAVDEVATVRIDVGPLAGLDRRTFIRNLLGLQDDLARVVDDRTAGNPLFAVQLVGDWVRRGILEPGDSGLRLASGAVVAIPDAIHDLWAQRVDEALRGLPAGSRAALDIAAVLEALRRAALIVPGAGRGWAFAHGLLVESLARRAGESGDLAAAQRVVGTMLFEHAAERDSHPAAAAPLAERAALALDGVDRVAAARARAVLASHLGLLGRPAEARAAFDAAIAVLDEAGVVVEAARARVGLAGVLAVEGLLPEAQAEATTALERLRDAGDPSVDDALAVLARIHQYRGDLGAARELLEPLATSSRRTGAARARNYRQLGDVLRDMGRLDEALVAYDQGVSLAAGAPLVRERAIALVNRASLLFDLGRAASAQADVEAAVVLCRETGYLRFEAYATDMLASIAYEQGDFELTVQHQRAALHLFQRCHDAMGEGNVWASLVDMLTNLGRLDEAAACLANAERIHATHGVPILLAWMHVAGCSLELARHDAGAAERHARRALELARDAGLVIWMARALSQLALVAAVLGRPEESARLASDALTRLDALPPPVRVEALLDLARAAAGRADLDEARRVLGLAAPDMARLADRHPLRTKTARLATELEPAPH
jgi:tetratricopeptide (TPR) repeat protein